MSFSDLKAEIENKDSLDKENAESQWSEGDICGTKGCEEKVIHRTHLRDSQIDGCPRHDNAPEHEFVCRTHGVVGSR